MVESDVIQSAWEAKKKSKQEMFPIVVYFPALKFFITYLIRLKYLQFPYELFK